MNGSFCRRMNQLISRSVMLQHTYRFSPTLRESQIIPKLESLWWVTHRIYSHTHQPLSVFFKTVLLPSRCALFQSITSGPFVSLSAFLPPPPTVVPISSPRQSRCQCAALSDTPHLFIHVRSARTQTAQQVRFPESLHWHSEPAGTCVLPPAEETCERHDGWRAGIPRRSNQSKHRRRSTFVQTVAFSLKHTQSPKGKHAKQ